MCLQRLSTERPNTGRLLDVALTFDLINSQFVLRVDLTMDDHDLEAMAKCAADDADRRLTDRIRGHAKKERRSRITRRILRWTFFTCAVVLGLMVYLEPEHEFFESYLLPITTVVGILSGGLLLLTGGLYPDRLAPVVTRQEKAAIDNRLSRERAAFAEETGEIEDEHEVEAPQLTDDSTPSNEFQFEGLPDPGADSPVSRHIESRKRYSRTASGAVAAIVIYALWGILTR